MTENRTIDEIRAQVRIGNLKGIDDNELHARLLDMYELSKEDLDLLNQTFDPDSSRIKSQKEIIAISAIALMTYGQLDVIEDVFGNVPFHAATKGIRALFSHFLDMLPVSEDERVQIRSSRENAMSWVSQNRNRLKWEESLQKYVFARDSD